MREEDLGTYQMLWDCPSCGTEKLLGLDHRHCPNCGAAQDPKWRYFPNDQDRVAVKDHRYTGADVVCPACESPASKSANNCASCGSPLDRAKSVMTRDAQTVGAGQSFAADSAKQGREELKAKREAEKAKARGEVPPAPPSKPGGKWKWILAGLALFVVMMIVVFSWKKPVEVETIGHEWVRTIGIEEYRSVSESAWRDQVPFGAYSVSCSREQRSTKKVADGETCNDVRKDQGDGTYKVVRECRTKYRDEPVYDQRCSYRVDRWVEARRAEARGAALGDTPRWPATNLRGSGQCLGCEREGAKSERYTVRFRLEPSKKDDACDFPEAKWRTFTVGQRAPAEARVIGGGLDCDTIGKK
ncbi:zinc ribbon domain-containing protein [Myxococcota bacterium]|nr:zinc ribbon domain-containing protein [Myxococcota bacterium]